MISHIDTDRYYEAGITFVGNDGFFPGGEPHANVPRWPFRHVNVHAKIRTWNDFGKLLAVLSALRQQNVRVHLFMPYVPGLRQDRTAGGLTPLTPQIYGEALSNLVTTVTTVDPHSEPGLAAFKRALDNKGVIVLDPHLYLLDLLPVDTYQFVVQPDNGAKERTINTGKILGLKVHNTPNEIIVCEKTRDFATGKLSGFEIPDYVSLLPADTRILVPDDICDGGGTFLGLAAAFHEKNPDIVLDLFVTHGIFSNGAIERLLNYYIGGNQGFDHIYTTDSFYAGGTMYGAHVTVLPLFPYYLGGLHP